MAELPTFIEQPPLEPTTVLVERARKEWIRKLIDPSRRNSLLFFRATKSGTFDLTRIDRATLRAILAGESIPVSDLANSRDEVALGPFRSISRRARANMEEKGLATLFLAYGMASWKADDGGREYAAPILLLPVELSEQRAITAMRLERKGNPEANLSLLHVLREKGISISPEDIVGDGGDDFDDVNRLDKAIREFRGKAGGLLDIRIDLTLILGNFSFQKMALVADLNRRAQEMPGHELVAALAGDSAARQRIQKTSPGISDRDIDNSPAEAELLVSDTDASQHSAILGVVAGQHLVIHGPPGTGKSQTIANLIALLASKGKRVLFVAEKRAALSVVKERLRRVGLDHLVLDLYGADQKPKTVMEKLAHALDEIRQAVPFDGEQVHRRFSEIRTKLNEHASRIHRARKPAGKSAFWLRGRLLALSENSGLKTRLRGGQLLSIDELRKQNISDLFQEAESLRDYFLRRNPTRWTGARFPTSNSVEAAMDAVNQSAAGIQELKAWAMSALTSQRHAASEIKWCDLGEFLAAGSQMRELLSRFSPTLFEMHLEELEKATSAIDGGWISRLWASLTDREFRRAIKVLRENALTPSVGYQALRSDLLASVKASAGWKRLIANTSPTVLPGIPEMAILFGKVRGNLAALVEAGVLLRFESEGIGTIERQIEMLQNEQPAAWKMFRVGEIERALFEKGAQPFVDEIRASHSEIYNWPLNFEYAWLSSVLESACAEEPGLRTFVGESHSYAVNEFRRLDLERNRLAASAIRRQHAEAAIQVMNEFPAQEQLIRTEASKSRRFKPVRKVISDARDVLTAVCPCLMASPLSVSQLLEGNSQFFDFVLFDEASQLLPEDSIPAILRGRHVVVAGDNKQLPPTPFFASGDDDTSEEVEEGVDGFESLLDMMIPITRNAYLNWHYRSKDESLIAFSNKEIYKWRLTTFPSASAESKVQHLHVSQKRALSQGETASEEVASVVNLVLDHARAKPNVSLGVIAMGSTHANRIQDLLDRTLPLHPELFDFFDSEKEESFFIKNLERVQGDERDKIILTIGCGKSGNGTLDNRAFGPLNGKNGMRRLNVAITRSREEMVVVSSFHFTDMDLTRLRPETGTWMLRAYLQYAANGGTTLGDGETTSVPLNDFEQDIFDSLEARGMKLVPQVGVSGYRIDMAAVHPRHPGQFVLAIECDGASYHSAPTARDRDRLRQQQLEKLGWRFHRIWSTDWFQEKDREIQRALGAYDSAIESASIPVAEEKLAQAAQAAPSNRTKPKRGPRPKIPQYSTINDYDTDQLVEVIQWIESDGQLRTDDQILAEAIPILGFNRRGSRIEAAIRRAIEALRR